MDALAFGTACLPVADIYFGELDKYVRVVVSKGRDMTTCCVSGFLESLRLSSEVKLFSDFNIRLNSFDPVLNQVLHFQQILRVCRLRDWPRLAPLWQVVATVHYLRSMVEYYPCGRWICNAVQKSKGLALSSTPRLRHGGEILSSSMSMTEKEALAIIYAVKTLYHYLYDTNFTIVTGHRPLQYLTSKKDPTG